MATKVCTKCKEIKLVSEFYKDRSVKSGLGSWCKKCGYNASRKWRKRNPNKVLVYSKRYNKTTKGKINTKRNNLKFKYNLTIKEHKQIYINQNGCCGLCGKSIPYNKIHTDHNHKTGKVRKLLCNKCNWYVGMVESGPELVNDTLKYLDEHK